MLFLLYLVDIYINTVLSKFIYIKPFIILSYIIFKSNLAVNTSNIYKNNIVKVIALVNKLYYFC